jgi:ketosteroid isomerase-like protein
MSQANVELMRENIEAFRRGDWDAVAAGWDTHVLVRADPSWPERFIYGREAGIDWQRSAWEALGPDVRIEETVDLGDRLLVRFCWHTRGQQSGIEQDLRFSLVSTYRDGRVVFAEYFLDHEQALEALGLEG